MTRDARGALDRGAWGDGGAGEDRGRAGEDDRRRRVVVLER